MKGLFIFPINKDIPHSSGIVKKNGGILAATASLGVEVDDVSVDCRGLLLNGQPTVRVSNNRLSRGLFNNYLIFNKLRWLDFAQYDFIWLRAGLSTPPFLALLRAINTVAPNQKVILEYGSFPFDDEIFGIHRWLLPFHRLLSPKLRNYCWRIITYCGQKGIYGIPCIRLGNGIDVDRIPFDSSVNRNVDQINLISVSGLMYWHAIDRVIDGLGIYYATRQPESPDVILNIVGEGPERSNLEARIAATGLGGKVILHGFRSGAALDQLFNESHLAIGTLGMHRKGLLADSSLKNREYFARGLPFILSTADADFPATLPFVKYVPGDDSPVDMDAAIGFYRSIVNRYPEYSTKIRSYAEEKLTWKSKMKQVLDEIGSEPHDG